MCIFIFVKSGFKRLFEVIEKNKILLGDCMDLMAEMPDNYIDYHKDSVNRLNELKSQLVMF